MQNNKECQRNASKIEKRSSNDRRKKLNKNYENDKRTVIRRKEDKENNIVYYSALFISFATIMIFFLVSILCR